MANIILVTGGSRSGKSLYAQRRAEELDGKKLFVASCPTIDDEMAMRIRLHQKDRKGQGWQTIEEETDIAGVLRRNRDVDIILVDCLTLWINNLIYHSQKAGKNIDESSIVTICDELLSCCNLHDGNIFFVTNEVGSGIVPESSSVRHYRDLVGRCNQCVGTHANEVVLVSCGIPLQLK